MTMTPRIAGTLVSLGLVALAIFAAIMGAGYGVIDDDGRVAGGFLPFATAVVVAVTGLLDARGRLKGGDEEEEGPRGPTTAVDIFGRDQKTRNRQLVKVLILIFGALLLVNVLGFLFAFAALIIAVSFFVEKKKILPTLAITAGTILVTWLVFDQFLQVPLPLGIFGG